MVSRVELPELGENVEEAEVLTVLVSVGDRVEKDQAVIEVETEKAAVEVPTPIAGVIKAVRVKPGDAIRVGQIIVEVESEGGEPADEKAEESASKARVPQAAAGEAVAVMDADVVEAEPTERRAREAPGPETSPLRTDVGEPAPAAPSVRRLARALGININEVIGRGPGGRISAEDVTQHARMLIQEKIEAKRGAPPAGRFPQLPDFGRYGPVQREPMSGVRRKTAHNVSRSWVTIPHVTQFDRADITELERARTHYAPRAEAAGSRLTLTAVVIKVVAAAVKIFPKFNASIDAENDEIVFKQYVNIGVAVDTDYGLLVPVIRDVDKKNLIEIGRELSELSQRARARKSRPEDLRGANLTVTNLGGLGTTYFSPLINWPEVAVVGIGRASGEAIYQDGAFAPRLILPLSVSYDHRIIDGADAARLLRWIAEALEHPLALALGG
jgi:pyruvate dehydrogenase E2 component (dihydrolipoamide acetyltransferase)